MATAELLLTRFRVKPLVGAGALKFTMKLCILFGPSTAAAGVICIVGGATTRTVAAAWPKPGALAVTVELPIAFASRVNVALL